MADFSKQPRISEFENVHLNCPQPIKLSNGIPVWVAGGGEDEIVRVDVFFGGGEYEEEKPGLSLLTSSMVLKGNAHKTPVEIAEAMDFYGSKLSGAYMGHTTKVTLSSLSRNFNDTLKILFDCVACPTFPADEFERFQQRFASLISYNEERVDYLSYIEMRKLYYGERCPFSRVMTADGFLSLTIDDMRAFHERYYQASNCRIVISGRVGEAEMQALNSTFGNWEKRGEVVTDRDEAPYEPSPKMLSVVDKKDALQSSISIAIRAIPRRHPDYFKLRIMMMALGGYFGSRLMTNIREDKGYTYGIDGALCGTACDGYLSITTSCDTSYTWLVVEEVKKEMRRMQSEPVSENELGTVKQHLLSDLMKTFDTPFNLARHLETFFTCGIYPEYFNEQVQAITHCTSADLMEMAQKYLVEDRMRIVVAGDKERLNELKEKPKCNTIA